MNIYRGDGGVLEFRRSDDNVMDMNLLKTYLRVDDGDDYDEALLFILVSTAEEYLAFSCGIPPDYGVSMYVLAIMLLCSHWYDNRNLIGKVEGQIEHSLNSLIMQLRYGGIKYEVI